MTPPTSPSLAILGCGWLGLPLARLLIAWGWRVNGSTTSADKLPLLLEAGVYPFLINITVNGVGGAFVREFLSADALVLCIPPGGRHDARVEHAYPQRIAALIPLIRRSPIRHVIYTSSTSVYPDLNRVVTERDAGNAPTPSGRACLAAERLLRDSPGFKTTVIRLGGLIGPGRHPVKFLEGRNGLEGGDAPVNLIRLDDAVGAIAGLLERPDLTGVYNACAPSHPARREFYTREAARLGVPAPDFSGAPESGKIVGCDRLQRDLNFTFRHADLLALDD